jgi:hypothetical protein
MSTADVDEANRRPGKERSTAEQERAASTVRTMQLVQTLPQELFDRVYDYTGTSGAGMIKVDETYRPPAMLQVTHAFRNTFADSYYTSNIFSFTTLEDCRQWLNVLERDHSARVRRIRYNIPVKHSKSTLGIWSNYAQRNVEMALAAVHWKLREGLEIWQPD